MLDLHLALYVFKDCGVFLIFQNGLFIDQLKYFWLQMQGRSEALVTTPEISLNGFVLTAFASLKKLVSCSNSHKTTDSCITRL